MNMMASSEVEGKMSQKGRTTAAFLVNAVLLVLLALVPSTHGASSLSFSSS